MHADSLGHNAHNRYANNALPKGHAQACAAALRPCGMLCKTLHCYHATLCGVKDVMRWLCALWGARSVSHLDLAAFHVPDEALRLSELQRLAERAAILMYCCVLLTNGHCKTGFCGPVYSMSGKTRTQRSAILHGREYKDQVC